MAGGGSLGGGAKPKRGKHGKRKKTKRVGFHLDMTPLVDITFLLLTFFMFTTTMATPQVMEMTVPPETSEVDVAVSLMLTILIEDDGKIYWYRADKKAEQVQLKEIKSISIRENLDVKNKIITVLKVSENAPYGDAIKILDQLNLAEVGITEQISKVLDNEGKPTKRQRKFTLLLLDEKDKVKIKESAL